MSVKVGTVSVFMPFNFSVLFGSRNTGHANIKGFTVLYVMCNFWIVASTVDCFKCFRIVLLMNTSQN